MSLNPREPASPDRIEDPCPFDSTQRRGGPCKYGERCPYFARRGKRTLCLGLALPDTFLGNMVAARVLLEE